jgi:hypothetical protein
MRQIKLSIKVDKNGAYPVIVNGISKQIKILAFFPRPAKECHADTNFIAVVNLGGGTISATSNNTVTKILRLQTGTGIIIFASFISLNMEKVLFFENDTDCKTFKWYRYGDTVMPGQVNTVPVPLV